MGPDNPCDQIRQSLKTMSKHLQEIFDFVKTASVDDLKQILDAVQNELPKREGKVDNFVVHVEDFCENEKLIKRVWEECESLPLTEERNKAPSSIFLALLPRYPIYFHRQEPGARSKRYHRVSCY